MLGWLLSFWYWRNRDLDAVLGGEGLTPGETPIFADSGAFSAATSGVTIDREEYAAWLRRWGHWFTTYANLDTIGDPEATWVNQQWFEDRGLSPLPVVHGGTDWAWLEHYAERYRYIGLGGLARKDIPATQYMPWVIECFRRAGPDVRFHGFGVTDWRAMSALPWESVDSTTWKAGHRFGRLVVFSRGKLVQIEKHLIPNHRAALAAIGYTVADARRAFNGDWRTAQDIAIASFAAASRALSRRHGRPMTIYLGKE